jgi:radical SAM protein with 4Fe4S-binding SPASM domain
MLGPAPIEDYPAPIQLFLELTSVCNLRCTHCYVRAGEGPRIEISPTDVCRIVDEFAEIGGQMVSISGGEPILYREWRAVVKYARFHGLETMLLTNGTRLTSEDISFLRSLDCAVAISVDGATSATHDVVRGHGNFDAVMKCLGRVVGGGMSSRTTLMFTPMATNAGDLPGVVAIADRFGIATVYVSLLEDRGRAHDRMSSLEENNSSLRSLIYSILSLQERYPHVAIQCLNLKMFTERLRGMDAQTEGIDRTLRVTAGGEMYLTAYLDDEPFRLGVFKPGRLREAWVSDKVKAAITAAQNRGHGSATPCQSCVAFPWCRGGSAAFAWNYNGSFDGEDGFCDAKRAIVRASEVPTTQVQHVIPHH